MVREESSKMHDALKSENEGLRVHLARMSDVNRCIAEMWDPDAVLQEIVDGARSLTDARYGWVGVFDGSGQIGEFTTSGIAPEQRRLLGSLSKGLGLHCYLNEIVKPLRLADLTQHSRSVGFPENDPPMNSFLGVPIPSTSIRSPESATVFPRGETQDRAWEWNGEWRSRLYPRHSLLIESKEPPTW